MMPAPVPVSTPALPMSLPGEAEAGLAATAGAAVVAAEATSDPPDKAVATQIGTPPSTAKRLSQRTERQMDALVEREVDGMITRYWSHDHLGNSFVSLTNDPQKIVIFLTLRPTWSRAPEASPGPASPVRRAIADQ